VASTIASRSTAGVALIALFSWLARADEKASIKVNGLRLFRRRMG
jgi:hypothetical protein